MRFSNTKNNNNNACKYISINTINCKNINNIINKGKLIRANGGCLGRQRR